MREKNNITSLLIIEEQDLLREGLETVFQRQAQFNLVASTSDVTEGLKATQRLQPNIVILGLNNSEMSADVCDTLARQDPDTKILLLTPPGREKDAVNAFKKGASGCLMTNAMADDLIQTISLLAKGQMVMPRSLAARGVVERRKRPRNLPNLSLRELEVLQLMANGLRNREIAAQLCLSEVTVKTHVSRILRKLNKPSRTAAILFAHRNGWINLQA